MGDRGNIAVIHSNNDQVWLYSHWAGYDLPPRLQRGLEAGRGRWNDECYLTKVIFGHVIPADNWTELTSYGISATMQDNEHPILVVDIPGQRVYTMNEDKLIKGKVPADYKPTGRPRALTHSPRHGTVQCGPWSFEEYVALEKLPWGESSVVDG